MVSASARKNAYDDDLKCQYSSPIFHRPLWRLPDRAPLDATPFPTAPSDLSPLDTVPPGVGSCVLR